MKKTKMILEKLNKVFSIVRKIRLRTIIALIVLLSFNSYAWFIYASKVSTGMSAHVSSWNVTFKAGNEVVTTQVVFDINDLYPGMPTQTKTLTAYNYGEMRAILSYKINSIRILNTTYTPGNGTTQEQILTSISNTWPFVLTFTIDNTNLNQTNGSADFVISFSWPFESGNDARDTQVGEMAYTYNQNNPSIPDVHIELEVQAVQNNNTP